MKPLKPDLYPVGVLNPTLRVFDIIMETEYGTTYNAYLIDDEQPTLVETVHENFFDAYLEKIQEVRPADSIRYIIFDHTEPDHSGSLARLLELCPEITVVASSAGIQNLKAITGMDFKSLVVRHGDTLNIGKRTLRFVSAPNLHWPDSMFTYSEYDRAVFTCDFLGAHYCEESMVDTRLVYPEKYRGALKNYYDAVLSPFKKFILAGLDRLAELDYDMVLTSHGPILTETRGQVVDLYRSWSAPAPREKKTAAIVYVSAYGYTKKLAEAAREYLEQAGLEVHSFDLVETPADVAFAMESDLLLVGSPTINRDALKPIWDFVASLDAINLAGKRCVVFGSYGWSGEGVPALVRRLTELKAKVSGDGFRVKFRPGPDDLAQFEELLKAEVQSL